MSDRFQLLMEGEQRGDDQTCKDFYVETDNASPETKLMVASRSVNLKLGYKAALSTLSLAEYRGIDNVMNGMYRRVTKNLVTFPTALL